MSTSDITGHVVGSVEPDNLSSNHYTLTLISKNEMYQGKGDANTQTPIGKIYGFESSFKLLVPPGWDGLLNTSGVTFQWGPEANPGASLEIKLFTNSQQIMSVASCVPADSSLNGSGGSIQCSSKCSNGKRIVGCLQERGLVVTTRGVTGNIGSRDSVNLSSSSFLFNRRFAPVHLTMPQNEYIEESIKQHGRRLDHEERVRKRIAREPHKRSQVAQSAFGLKAKLLHQRRHAEKVQLKKTLKAHDERNVKTPSGPVDPQTARPTYLLDRDEQKDAKALSTAVKQKRKDKAAKYAVPLPKVRGIAEQEMFKVLKTGKTGRKSWKRMITKATFVGEAFTRKPVKLERFIRPMALRFKKANVTHPDLKATFQLPIISVKKNPQSPMYTQLGVLTKGTIIEVNVSELGLVTTGGKAVWGKYAQVTNNPENDGCINAVLLV